MIKTLYILYYSSSNIHFLLLFSASKAAGVAPQFTSKPAIRQLGSSVVFQVSLLAAPPPSITWYKGTSAISHGSHYNITTQTDGLNYILRCEIMDVDKTDGGTYKVTAKNPQGEANANINLNLEGRWMTYQKCRKVFCFQMKLFFKVTKIRLQCLPLRINYLTI